MIAMTTDFGLDSLKVAKNAFALTSAEHFSQIKRNDMRRRLSWLRRKSDSGSTRVRPTPEEARNWSESFGNLVASRYGLTLFRAFLRREFNDESMEFLLAVEDYRDSRSGKLAQKAAKIHSEFIAAHSAKAVNIDSETRTIIADKVNSQDKTIFDKAQKKIQFQLESDAYIRFLQSDLYRELLDPDSSSSSDSA